MDTSSAVIAADTKSGRVCIMADPSVLPIPMVRIDGAWYKAVLDAVDLNENFSEVTQPRRRERLLKKAKKIVASYPEIVNGPWLHETEAAE